MIENAAWIWTEARQYTKDLHAYFREDIPLKRGVQSVKIEITAGDHYLLFVNGSRVGEGPSPAAPAAYYYDTYTVTPEAGAGRICLFIHAYAIGDAEMVTEQNQAPPGVLFAVTVCYEDGSETVTLSSEHCRAEIPAEYFHDYIQYDEARISKWGGFEEVYLSHRQTGDPASPAYDASQWAFAAEVKDARAHDRKLIPREIPMLMHDTAWPEEVLQVEPYLGEIQAATHMCADTEAYAQVLANRPQSYPSVVLDFGTQVVGHPVIEVWGSEGASMRMLYGESLDLMRMDTLVMNGARQKYRPYQRRAFRFLKLTFHGSMEPIRVYRVFVETERYPFHKRGSFVCSDEVLNQIYETSIRTVQLNAQEHFEDCVVREKMQWLADARVMSLVAYWNFGDSMLSRKAIRQFFRIQREDGLILSAGPQPMHGPNVDFAEHFVLMLHEYWTYTGDQTLILENMDSIKRLLRFFSELEDSDGLLNMAKCHTAGLFLDWANIDKREKVTIVNCMYCEVLRCYGDFLELAGEAGAGQAREKAAFLSRRVMATFFDPKQKLLCDCAGSFGRSAQYSEQSSLCAVFTHTASKEEAAQLLDRLFGPERPENVEPIRGAFYLSLALQGLFEQGRTELALEYMESFWGAMLARGAKTWWETFDPSTPACSIPDLFSTNSATSYIPYIPCSHCHGWGAGPAYLLGRFVLGIEPAAPGFRKVRIRPQLAALDWAKGRVPTPYGDIVVECRKLESGETAVSAELPACIERVE